MAHQEDEASPLMVSRLLNVCQVNRVGHPHYDDVVAGLRRHESVRCEIPGTAGERAGSYDCTIVKHSTGRVELKITSVCDFSVLVDNEDGDLDLASV